MTLIELQKIMGDRLSITLDETLSPEQREIENAQTDLVIKLGKQMINNANSILNGEKFMAANKSLTKSVVPEIIGNN